jgi:hypothetical protein
MLNTHMSKERELPLWAIGAPAIGIPLMVALLALTAPKYERPVDGADLGAPTEQVERQAAHQASSLPSDCIEPPSSS